jgi:hypothetical protein
MWLLTQVDFERWYRENYNYLPKDFVFHTSFKLMFNTFTAKLLFNSDCIMNARISDTEKVKIPI